MKDSAGPFDYHLTHKLLELCNDYGIRHQRDVFSHYRCDSASAIEAGNDIYNATAAGQQRRTSGVVSGETPTPNGVGTN